MKGIYRFSSDGLREFKTQLAIRKAPVILLIFTPFFIAPVFFEPLRDISYVLAILLAIVLFFVGFTIGKNMFSYTTIEICEDKIIRFGKNLTRAELEYSEIGRIDIKTDGVHIFKKGLNKGLIFMFDKYPLTNRDDLIFIPMGIDSYESIVDYVKLRVKEAS